MITMTCLIGVVVAGALACCAADAAPPADSADTPVRTDAARAARPRPRPGAVSFRLIHGLLSLASRRPGTGAARGSPEAGRFGVAEARTAGKRAVTATPSVGPVVPPTGPYATPGGLHSSRSVTHRFPGVAGTR